MFNFLPAWMSGLFMEGFLVCCICVKQCKRCLEGITVAKGILIALVVLWLTWSASCLGYLLKRTIRPRLLDVVKLDLALSQQSHLLLANMGIDSPEITDLHELKHYHIAIAGMVKNAEKSLPNLMRQIEMLSCAFNTTHIFVLESNSVDGTREIIRNWAQHPPQCEDVRRRMYKRHALHGGGNVSIHAIQPDEEFDGITKWRSQQNGPKMPREERYVVYRNVLLDAVTQHFKAHKARTGISIDYLFWIDMDLRAFDLQGIANEFSAAWRDGHHVVCANSIKYSGWYYDSYATVFRDWEWAYPLRRWVSANRIRKDRFSAMQSCFGGVAAYDLPFAVDSECRYHHISHAVNEIESFSTFADTHKLNKTCEHIPFNFCLGEHGGKLAVASGAHSFYGTIDAHGVDRRRR